MNVTKNKAGANVYSYVYNYTDHLGNIRLRYTSTGLGNGIQKLEENHYYPFGLKHKKYNSYQYVFVALNEIDGYDLGIDPLPERGRDEYQYKYNGKEFQDELGLNVYDYGARNYDAALGRWMNIDPLAEISRRFSLYAYALDNPVYFIDRDGMYADTIESQNEEECCSGFPFQNNPPKSTNPLGGTLNNFTPSDKTANLLKEGKKLLSNVFDYEVGVEIGYSVRASATIGPVKGEGEVILGSASVKTTGKNLVEATVEGPALKGSASAGNANASGKLETGSAKIEVDKQLNVKTNSSGRKATGETTLGQNNKLSLKSSGTLGASVKLPTPQGVGVKVGASVNLYNATKGTAKMLNGAASYLSDYVSNVFNWE